MSEPSEQSSAESQTVSESTSAESTADESSEIPSSASNKYTCEFCGDGFDDGAKMGRHIGAKHRKETKARKQQEIEAKRSGMDVIREVTGGMSEQEYIAQEGEIGFDRLKKAWLEKLLNSSPISPKTIDYVLTYYNLNVGYRNNNNELHSLMKAAGIQDKVIDIMMKSLVNWEDNARSMLYESSGYVQSSAYGPSGGMPRFDRPMGQYSSRDYSQPSIGMPPRYDKYPPQGRTPPPYDSYGQQQSGGVDAMTLMKILDERDAKKEKGDRLDRLENAVANKDQEIIKAVKKLMEDEKKKSSGSGEDPYRGQFVEYEEVIMDPANPGKPLMNEKTDQPIMRIKKVPMSAMPTLDSNKQENSEVIRIRADLEAIKNKPESDPAIEEMKKELQKSSEKFDKLKDEMNSKQQENFKNQIEDLRKQIENASKNTGEWKSDTMHLVSELGTKFDKIIERREPIGKVVKDILIQPEQRHTKPGETDIAIKYADEEGVPTEGDPSEESVE